MSLKTLGQFEPTLSCYEIKETLHSDAGSGRWYNICTQNPDSIHSHKPPKLLNSLHDSNEYVLDIQAQNSSPSLTSLDIPSLIDSLEYF